MLISEVVKVTGVPKKTIYYYEEEQLIQPEILENGYRDFQDKDIVQLQLVAKLREVGLPIKDIQKYLSDVTQEKKILKDQLLRLHQDAQNLSSKIEVCNRLLKNDVQDYIGNSIYPKASKIVQFPFTIGEKNSRGNVLKWVMLGLCIGSFMSSSLLVVGAVGIPGTLAIMIGITVLTIVAFLPMSVRKNTTFTITGMYYYGENFSTANRIMQALRLLFIGEMKELRNFVSYDDIIDTQIVWLREPTMKGWTVPKVWVALHSKNDGTIRLDVLEIEKLAENIPIIMRVLASNEIPIFDEHRIIGALSQGERLSDYLETLIFE